MSELLPGVGLGTALGGPALVMAFIAVTAVVGRGSSERSIGLLTVLAVTAGLLGIAVAGADFIAGGREVQRLSLVPVGSGGAFSLDLLVEGRSLAFAAMSSVMCVVVSVFARRYLHREFGYRRYFLAFNLFVLGLLLISTAGSSTLLFAGWEFLGLSSALLVAFFHDRVEPVRNAMRVLSVYRLSDAAMLSAAILAHQATGSPHLDGVLEGAPPATLAASTATAVSLLLVLAAAGKCAQWPFSGWLPRAMEGPTPSSAVYYGALSVHAGALVLLRSAPVLEAAPAAQALLIAMGLTTAAYSALVARVQTDVKSALAFRSLTQVSLVLVEIGLGWYDLALVHMIGHAFLRLLQILRAPSALHDLHEATGAVGAHVGPSGWGPERLLPRGVRPWAYRFALERGYVDGLVDRYAVGPLLALAGALDRIERRWCALVSGVRWSAGRRRSLPVMRDE